MTAARRLVLVTGTPRSGTTPVGDVLAAGPGSCALYEPLNFHVGDRRVRRYFEIPGADGFGDADVDELAAAVRELRLQLRPGLFPEDSGLRRLVKRVTGSQTRASYRRCRLRRDLATIVWKDPFAAFLAPRLAARHGIPTVATVRPPAAVAASFKRLNWRFDVADLARRCGAGPALLSGLDLDRPAVNAAALWHLVNGALLGATTDGVHLLDMERVVADRTGEFRRLYERLGLTWSAAVLDRVQRSGRGTGPARPSGTRAHGGQRDPRAVNDYWRDVLDRDELLVTQRLNDELWQRVRAAAA